MLRHLISGAASASSAGAAHCRHAYDSSPSLAWADTTQHHHHHTPMQSTAVVPYLCPRLLEWQAYSFQSVICHSLSCAHDCDWDAQHTCNCHPAQHAYICPHWLAHLPWLTLRLCVVAVGGCWLLLLLVVVAASCWLLLVGLSIAAKDGGDAADEEEAVVHGTQVQ